MGPPGVAFWQPDADSQDRQAASSLKGCNGRNPRDLRRHAMLRGLAAGAELREPAICETTGRRGVLRKWIDIPPLWLASFLLIAWWQARHYPLGLSFGRVWADLLGGVMVGGGLLLVALAITEMRRNRTTVMPHEEAAQLVTSGIFSWSRNPIYLGDSLILTGLVLYWDAVPSLALVPVFVWIIEKRFIEKEEMFLRRKFLARYERYLHQTRRWL